MSAETQSSCTPFSAAVGSKPPLSPEPAWLWREKRMWHLIERLAGFVERSDCSVSRDHLIELRDRIDDVLARKT